MENPSTVFEVITGIPAPREEAVTAEPMNMEHAGAACDFCPNGPFYGTESPPVVWVFPAGQVENSAELVPGSGIRIGMPIATMLWKACERCRQHIKANKWADLARDCGYPEGSGGSLTWEGFRVARLPGPGYAWPLVPHKLPTVHKQVRDAWETGKLAFADHVRERLERAALLVELDGHLYVRVGEAGDDQWLTETVGEGLVAPFGLYLDRSVRITLLPSQP
ncbi:hypothetical protein [Streptomyces aureocirculatus]|uniref:hypothetical protein n=1 Tax=Streptomyces aureocirculatus TaxID=67275 RepID=UPI0012FEF319|nr:hypothetical protein [Streptomyces aureocirculatus]